jgi:hypothetical protein
LSGSIALVACLALAGLAPPLAAEIVNQVSIAHGPLTIDHSKTVADITRAQASGGKPAQYGLGLFRNSIDFALSVSSAPQRPGVLAVGTQVKTAPTIYIASEFPEDSCAYAVILEHERRHYLFDLEVLRLMPDHIRRVTQEIFPDHATWSARDIEAAKGVYFQRVKYVYEALSFPQHVSIDNPESYAELGNRCSGEISKRLTGQARR